MEFRSGHAGIRGGGASEMHNNNMAADSKTEKPGTLPDRYTDSFPTFTDNCGAL